MKNYSNNFEKFGIYLAKIHFDDKPNIYKIRPVVVLDEEKSIVLVLKVTSKVNQTRFLSYYLENWANYGLNVPSSVIIDFVYEVKMNDIYRDKYLGKLNEKDSTNILILLLNQVLQK